MKTVVLACGLLAAAPPAQAYIGPGASLGAVVAALAIVLALILLCAGFLWYPLKRWMRGRKRPTGRDNQNDH
jgi:hypothetical protein